LTDLLPSAFGPSFRRFV